MVALCFIMSFIIVVWGVAVPSWTPNRLQVEACVILHRSKRSVVLLLIHYACIPA
jgi:hypothetical protein